MRADGHAQRAAGPTRPGPGSGVNAIHAAGEVLRRLEAYEARAAWSSTAASTARGSTPCRIRGGVAGNVIPDRCEVDVNFRFAPDRTEAEAQAHLREVFDGYDVEITDSAPGALPGLAAAPAAAFLAAVGSRPVGKLGWTDVARFAALGVPALNFGPGDPNLAHTTDEHVEISKIREGRDVLRRWLSPPSRDSRRSTAVRVS